MGARARLFNCQHIPVRQQFQREVVIFRQLPAHHQRRTHHAPQRHHRPLLRLREVRPAVRVVALPQRADGQHVRIRPMPRRGVYTPLLRPLKHPLEQPPFVPEVVRDAPHVRVFLQMLRLLQRRGAGRQRQHNVPSAGAAGVGNDLDFPLAVRIFARNVVALDEIHAPLGVHAEDAVIIRAGFGHVAPQAVHIGIPRADAVRVCDLVAALPAIQDRQMPMRRHPRHSAHDVDAEFQPQRMDIIRQRLEALSARRRRESPRRGLQAPVFIHRQFSKRLISVARRGRLIPLNVHNDVLPAELLQVLRHVRRVLPHGCLVHRRAVAVPAVPSHRGRLCNHVRVLLNCS